MSNNAIVQAAGGSEIVQFDNSKVELIRRTVAKGATDDEMELFLHQCRKMGLDPIAKQLVFTKFKNKDGSSSVAFITSIDAYRLIADRTGCYAGNDAPVFEGNETAKFYNDSRTVPAKATVTVWKLVGGQRVPFSASARWDEYYPGQHKGTMWFKMPTVMLSKCAEAAALRKAFPADLSNAYIREEMDQSDFATYTELKGDISQAQELQSEYQAQVVADAELVEIAAELVAPTTLKEFGEYIAAKDPRYKNNIHVVQTLKKFGVDGLNFAQHDPVTLAAWLNEYRTLRESDGDADGYVDSVVNPPPQ